MLVTTTVLTFSMGASPQALFARVGGDSPRRRMGRRPVGKVEAGIPEDDPRNPALSPTMSTTSATSPVWGRLVRVLLQFAAGRLCPRGGLRRRRALQGRAITAPFMIAGLGIPVSIVGVHLRAPGVRPTRARCQGPCPVINTSAVLVAVLSPPAPTGWECPTPGSWGLWRSAC